MILEPIGSFTTFQSYTIEKSQFNTKHCLKINPNPTKLFKNPSFDQFTFKPKFLPILQPKRPK